VVDGEALVGSVHHGLERDLDAEDDVAAPRGTPALPPEQAVEEAAPSEPAEVEPQA
jgi:hypothetical protein